ncbi:unnamed protein product [Orchesella dallaii]|uniref:Odorant receptor n=1 Tax=Orchesella dallaii TaxID=48710 RepID=A0ABP1R1L6_9HEXA
MEKDPQELCYLNNQLYHRAGVKYRGWPSSRRLPNLQELVAYGMAISFCIFPFACASYPLIRSYDPMNVELKDVLPNVPRRVIAALCYGFVSFFAANACCSFLLTCITMVYGLQMEAETNYKLSLEMPTDETPRQLERIIDTFLKKAFLLLEKTIRKNQNVVKPTSFNAELPYITGMNINIHSSVSTLHIPTNKSELRQCINEKFKKRRNQHIQLRLIMSISNKTVDVFGPTMAIVGMLICVLFNYTIISMYDREDFKLFIGMGICLLVCINTLILFMCKHAAMPLILTSDTITFWIGKLRGPVEKRQVRCMRPVGYTLGGFFYAKRDTALEINDIILNLTINLLIGEV